jgi:tetratricopeptide (TPR) repeat protein
MRYTSFRLSFNLALAAGFCCAGMSAFAADPPVALPNSGPPNSGKSAPQSQPEMPPGVQRPDPQGEARKRSGRENKADTPMHPGKTASPGVTPKGIAVQPPRTAVERDKALANLYALLATAADEGQAKTVADSIERLWGQGSDTVAVLMERAHAALVAKKVDLALRFLDAAVELEPANTEGWTRRAHVYMGKSDVERSLGDLRRVLALDPNHFRALDDLVQILKTIGQKKAALKAARQLLDVHPFWEGGKKTVEELERAVEGESL